MSKRGEQRGKGVNEEGGSPARIDRHIWLITELHQHIFGCSLFRQRH